MYPELKTAVINPPNPYTLRRNQGIELEFTHTIEDKRAICACMTFIHKYTDRSRPQWRFLSQWRGIEMADTTEKTTTEQEEIRVFVEAIAKIKRLARDPDAKRTFLAGFIEGYNFQGVVETFDSRRMGVGA